MQRGVRIVRVAWVAVLLLGGLLSAADTVRADAIPVTGSRYNNSRTGSNLQETILTASNVNQTTFGKLFSRPLDGQMFGQPLYVPGITIGGTKHNVLFGATLHNSVYAWDADSNAGETLWKHTVDDVPVPLPNQNCCGNGPPFYAFDNDAYADIKVELGILGTPAIDTATNTIYVVAMGQSGPNCNPNAHVVQPTDCEFKYRIHALDLLTGAERVTPREVVASVPGCAPENNGDPVSPRVLFTPVKHIQRTALTVANGSLYVVFGSFRDDNPYHGWVMRYDAATLVQGAVFASTPYTTITPNCTNTVYSTGGGLWASGEGPIVDPQTGALYVTTGNGPYVPTASNYTDSVVRLDGTTLAVTGYFSPYDNESYGKSNPASPGNCPAGSDGMNCCPAFALGYNCYDLDLGSTNGMLIPNSNLLLATGKVGRLFLIDRTTNLGHRAVGPGDTNIVQSVKGYHTQPTCLAPNTADAYRRYDEECTGHTYGAPVFWDGPGGNAYIYVWPRYDALTQYRFTRNGQSGSIETRPDTDVPTAPNGYNTVPYANPVHERNYIRDTPGSEFTPHLAGGFLALSANGTQAGSGIVWAAVAVTPPPEHAVIYAFDAADVTHLLWSSDQNLSRDGVGYLTKFQPPVVVNGRMYANGARNTLAPANDPTNVNRLHVYGLLRSAISMTAMGFPTVVAAGEVKTITVTLRDKDGVAAAGYTGTVQLTSTDPAALLPAPHTFTTNENGQYTFSAVLRTPGTHAITATDTTAGGYTATQSGIAVFAATAIAPSSGGTMGGNNVTITGGGFTAGATVTFGGTPAPVTGMGAGGASLVVTAPAHGPGAVDVVVTMSGSHSTLPGAYTYGTIAPAPTPSRPASPTTNPATPVGARGPTPRPAAPTVLPSTGTPAPAPLRR